MRKSRLVPRRTKLPFYSFGHHIPEPGRIGRNSWQPAAIASTAMTPKVPQTAGAQQDVPEA